MFLIETTCLTVFVIMMLVSVFFDSGVYFSIGAVLSAIFTVFIIGAPVVIAAVIANFKIVLIGLILYFIAGGLWSIFKWWRFNVSIKNRYDEIIDSNPSEKMSDILYSIRVYYKNKDLTLPPRASKMKTTITLWIVSWPWSMIAWVLGDFVMEICTSIYKMLGNVYDRITKSIFGDSFKFD